MRRIKRQLVCLVGITVSVLFCSVNVVIAGDASQYPLDKKLANEPAPWTVKGKWGERGKVYTLGEEMYNNVPRLITPVRFGPQILQERDGYDRVTRPGEFDPKQRQGAASYTIMHNHTGTHLDTFAHVYHENKLYNNMPAPRPAPQALVLAPTADVTLPLLHNA